MKYREEDIEKLIEELDIVDVISQYVDLKKAGANYKGFSPFKDEKTPSFIVSPSKNIFKCFSTGIGGNAISFYMKINKLDFVTAIEELSEKYKIKLRVLKQGQNKKNNENAKYYEIMESSLEFFRKQLYSDEGKEAREYFYNRGFEDEFIKKHKLAYSLNSWDKLLNYLKEKSYNLADIEAVGLIKKSENSYYDTFRDRVMFPIYSPKGNLIAFGGRILTDKKEKAKYLNSPETAIFNKSKNLYGIVNNGYSIRKKSYVLLMEGYMDVLSAHKNSFDTALASLGTSFTEEQTKLLKKYTNNVIICYDMDEAGLKATEKAIFILKKYDFNIRVLELEGAKDPDEFLNKFGRKAFLESIKKSKEAFDFLYSFYSKNYNLNDLISKKSFILNFKDFFQSLSSEIEESLYLERLSINIGIAKENLEMVLINNKKKTIKPEKKYFRKEENENIDKLELETLSLILKNQKYYEKLSLHPLKDQFVKKILIIIFENLNSKNLEKKILENKELSEKERVRLIDLIYSVENIENEEEFFKDIENSWQRKLSFIKEKELKKEAQKTLSDEEQRELLYKRFELIKSRKLNK